MTHQVSAETSSDEIRALREDGREPIFTMNEELSLDEIIAAIDWSQFDGEVQPETFTEIRSAPVYHLDEIPADQLMVSAITREKALAIP